MTTPFEALEDLESGCTTVDDVIAKLQEAGCYNNPIIRQWCATCPIAQWCEQKLGVKVIATDTNVRIEGEPEGAILSDLLVTFVKHYDKLPGPCLRVKEN